MAEKKNTIGRFEILEKIGEGPIGAVYKALDPVIRRTVAIKVIKLYALEETTTFAEIFEKIYRVVRTSTSLNHPNICIIYDLSEEKKIPYITMEFVEGQDIDALLQKKHQFKRVQLLNILNQVCDALDFAHKKNVIHQDLKTTNILVTPDLQVKITDFGIAGLDEIAAAQTKKLLSIPFYISPEQALGEKVTAASDLFSLGVIMYHLLSGELPFRGTTAANVIMTIARDNPVVPTNIQKSGIEAGDWTRFFNRALSKEPDKRFTSAQEMYDALVELIPQSEHSYFPYTFSGGPADNTGKFEKTFVSESVASPTVMIDASKIFGDQQEPPQAAPEPAPEPALADVSETLIGEAIDTALAFDQPEPSTSEITHPEFNKAPLAAAPAPQPAAEPAPQPEVSTPAPPGMEEEEGIATILSDDMDQTEAGKTMMVNPPVIEEIIPPPPAAAAATKLINIPQEFISEPVSKSNGSDAAVAPAAMEGATVISVPVEKRQDPVALPIAEEMAASSKPTLLLQGVAAIADPQVAQIPQPAVQPLPPAPAPPAPQRIQTAVPSAAVRKAAGPPNLKRYLIAAVVLAFFIALAGGYLLLRKPAAEEVAQGNTGSQSSSSNTTKTPSAGTARTENPGGGSIVPPAIVTGTISITSTPAGAKVLVNGIEKGVTPIELNEVAAGNYDVLLQLNGYKDLQQIVDLNEQNANPAIQAVLEKAAATVGTLVVESTPAEAFIVINNRVVGVTPKTMPGMKTGKYNILLKKDGYQDYTGSVRISADKSAAVRAHLVEIPKPPAPVQVEKKEEPAVTPGMVVALGTPGLVPPRSTKRTFAKYPEAAKARKIQGTVTLSVLVSETGKVIDIRVTNSPNKLLEDAAVSTVRQWIYEPGRKDGVPVKVWVPVSVAFQVSNQ